MAQRRTPGRDAGREPIASAWEMRLQEHEIRGNAIIIHHTRRYPATPASPRAPFGAPAPGTGFQTMKLASRRNPAAWLFSG